MKKVFKKEGKILFDEVINAGFDEATLANKPRKKLSRKLREKYLADLGTGSETEYKSASELYWHADNSPEFLEYLLSCCEKEDACLHPGLSYSLIAFKDDERVLPALLKSARKCSDEDFSNYAGLLQIFGGKEAFEILRERFDRIKENPKTFAKMKDYNELGFSLLDISETLLKNEPNNPESAEVLVKLSKHPCSFNREIAVSRIVNLNRSISFWGCQSFNILFDRLKELSKTKDVRMFMSALDFLFTHYPEKTYQKFVKFYLKCDTPAEINLLVWRLSEIRHFIHWTSRLVRELPADKTAPLRDILNLSMVTPITQKEIFDSIRGDFADESPNKRISAIERLKHLDKKEANLLVEEALKDEPDKLIQKQLKKYLIQDAQRK